jgi:hypothetical protein
MSFPLVPSFLVQRLYGELMSINTHGQTSDIFTQTTFVLGREEGGRWRFRRWGARTSGGEGRSKVEVAIREKAIMLLG